VNARNPIGFHATGDKALAYRPQILDEARAQPCYEGADDVSDWAQTYRPAKPADSDDVFSQDEDYDDAQAVRELLSQRPKPTPEGKWVGIATDACAALIELQRLIGELDFFSAGDTGLGRLTQASQRANAVLQRAGYRNENAA
jgi:hypothetical protein